MGEYTREGLKMWAGQAGPADNSGYSIPISMAGLVSKPPRRTSQDEEDEAAVAWLKARVEDLSKLTPQTSVAAYTHSRVPHVAFCNGEVKAEGEEVKPIDGNVRDAVEATLEVIRAYRNRIEGPVLLTWRKLPEVTREGGLKVYCRLCLEPDQWA